jgi:hypothetical protein
MPAAPFADAGSPLILVPFAGAAAAGLFAAAAAVAGGVWLANRPAAPRARTWFLVSAGVACLTGALGLGAADLFGLPVPGVAAVPLLAAGGYLLWRSARSFRRAAPTPADAATPPPP